MKSIISRTILPRASIGLALALLLFGCSTPERYYLPGQTQLNRGGVHKLGEDRQVHTVRLEVGDDLRAVRPSRGFAPGGGYWVALWTEDPEIARVKPMGDSFIEGSRLEAVAPGETKGYYLNLFTQQRLLDGEKRDEFVQKELENAVWFHIEVEANDSPDPRALFRQAKGAVEQLDEGMAPGTTEQVRTHPRFQMPVEVDFTALIAESFQDAPAKPESEKWLERYRAADRSAWRGEWPEQPDWSPSQVLFHESRGNFYAQWYRGWPTGWSEKTYPAYVSGLFLLEDALAQSGREAEIADLTERFHAAWAVICGDRKVEWPETPAGGWPEPMGDLLEVLAAGSRAAPEHPAFERLRDWMRRTEVGSDALALPLANFVVGLGFLRDDPKSAAEHFQAVRQSVRAGAPDWDHLAAQSYGWEGAAALQQGDILAAWERYVDGNVAGFSDLPSLIRVYQEMLYQEEDFLEPLAFVPPLTWPLLLFTLREPPRYGRIPMEEEKARFGDLMFESIPVNPPLGPIMAMLAERRGEPERRQIWLEESFEDDPLAWYLHYRDALQAGEIEEAFAWQDKMLALWSANDWEEWQEHFLWRHLRVGGEFLHRSLALDRAWMLALQGEFVEAIPWFLVAEPPTAMAIGERLLTTDEIREVHDRLESDTEAIWQTFGYNSFDRWPRVLSGRLAREGNWAEAAELISLPGDVEAFEKIIPLLEGLENLKGEPVQQAEQLFATARAIRDNGSVSGTLHVAGIIHDDGRLYSGVHMFRMRRMSGQSFVDQVPFRLPMDWISERLAATADTNHLHGRTYRYSAANLAWQAAERLPDNDEQAAKMLWHGGVWLMYIDPQAANRFYRALVLRHRETELGRTTAENNWFPKTWPPAE
ncbi:MAG: hypothetical protein LAT58_02255 [Opitutales bacterium]|nr:hypothetical protein [Opitutales bacterium]